MAPLLVYRIQLFEAAGGDPRKESVRELVLHILQDYAEKNVPLLTNERFSKYTLLCIFLHAGSFLCLAWRILSERTVEREGR